MLKHIFIFVVCISVTYARSQHTNGRIVGKQHILMYIIKIKIIMFFHIKALKKILVKILFNSLRNCKDT